MSFDLSKDPKMIQEIVTKRRVVREELANKIIAIIENTPAGYGKTLDSFKMELIARIKALLPEDD